MGCGTPYGSKNPEFQKVHHAWNEALKSTEGKNSKSPVIHRSGWKTVRIFVSSTFRDFHEEREILVKKVFPDLRLWCESKRINLVECDLRWGVPKDSTTEDTFRTCLGEIDRCCQENSLPFFLNMTSHRAGWVPHSEEISEQLRSDYKWVDGLSVTEMEIVHAALRCGNNPNALFMLRDESIIKNIPEEYRNMFEESQPLLKYKLEVLKGIIKDRFPNVIKYKCSYNGINDGTKKVRFSGLDGKFSKSVYEFFKKRIELQYPLPDIQLAPHRLIRDKHESFMNSRSQHLIGRDQLLTQIEEYVSGSEVCTPLLIVGESGIGKTSIMTFMTKSVKGNVENKQLHIPGQPDKEWSVFYHFVGAVPGSTDLLSMLQRLLLETKTVNEMSLPTDLEEAVVSSITALQSPKTVPTIIIIDAINQMDEDNAALIMKWLPWKLAPQIRCILSVIPETPQYKAVLSRGQQPLAITVKSLDLDARKTIVENVLGHYNKRLDEEQMKVLMSKHSSENPLWLSIACEELRVFGMFRQLSNKINQLADDLFELEKQVMSRFEEENGGSLVVATLCLLEASVRGLLENELLYLLADENNLNYLEDAPVEEKEIKAENGVDPVDRLPAYRWAPVFRALRPFIRPFGDSGEGRLHFYHQSFSKAVQQRYFSHPDDNPDEKKYLWWHGKLASFFQTSTNKERRFEEYPEHLVKLDDKERLRMFLSEWEVIEEWVMEEFSYKLVAYWRKAGGFETMEKSYTEKIQSLKNQPNFDKHLLAKRYATLAQIFSQTGLWEKAREILAEAKALHESLNSPASSMLEIYQLEASIEDEDLRREGFLTFEHIPRMRKIIDSFEKVTSICDTLTGDAYKFKKAMALKRLSYHYNSLTMCGGDDKTSGTEARNQSIHTAEASVNIFKELKDEERMADALIMRGAAEGTANLAQIKYYEEAEKILLQGAGEMHIYMECVHLNMGIYYEDVQDPCRAYEHFYKCYEVIKNLYGMQHPKIERHIETLRETKYQNIAAEKGIPVPEPYQTATSHST